jgi:hypothetical protein
MQGENRKEKGKDGEIMMKIFKEDKKLWKRATIVGIAWTFLIFVLMIYFLPGVSSTLKTCQCIPSQEYLNTHSLLIYAIIPFRWAQFIVDKIAMYTNLGNVKFFITMFLGASIVIFFAYAIQKIWKLIKK